MLEWSVEFIQVVTQSSDVRRKPGVKRGVIGSAAVNEQRPTAAAENHDTAADAVTQNGEKLAKELDMPLHHIRKVASCMPIYLTFVIIYAAGDSRFQSPLTLSVCLIVRALKGKQLKLSTPKSLEIQLYALECFQFGKADRHSLDFTSNRLCMKLFKTGSTDVVKDCQSYFAIDLPSCVLKRRHDKFILRCVLTVNGFCQFCNKL